MSEKIYKYLEFLKENNHDTPETYVQLALKKLQKRIEKMFTSAQVEDGEVKRYGEKQDLDRKEKGELSFMDLGLQMQSLELSKYSKIYDNLKLKFTDEEFLYDILFTIDLKDALPKSKDKDYSDEEIKNCQIKFKKYSLDDFELVAGPLVKTVELEKIDEEFLIELKIELEESGGESEEDFEIETEE
jgi:hypothetical protein